MKKNTYPGKFIVFEGIDGSGGETQSAKLVDFFKARGIPVEHLMYPDYQGPIAKLIHEYLHGKYEFSKNVQFFLYFADFLKDKEKIQQWLSEGKTIVSDRYFTSTIAYQCFNGVPLQKALQMAKMFDLPVPGKVFYLEISAQTSVARKNKEKQGNLDRNESDEKFLSNLRDVYRQLIDENIFAQWEVIDGEQSIEKVSEDIVRALK